MKEKLLLKNSLLLKIFIFSLFICLPFLGHAQERALDENFEYNEGSLYTQGGWVRYGANTVEPIEVISSALIYPGYQDVATGKAIELKTTASGEDLQKQFDTEGTKEATVYVSALMNFKDVSKITAGKENYFFNLVAKGTSAFKDGGSGIETGRLNVKVGDIGKFYLGVARGNTTIVYSPIQYDLDQTYLVVMKYEVVSGTTNDAVSLYVNPVINATEQTPVAICNASGAGSDVNVARGFEAIELRQGTTASKESPNVIIDAIRVAYTWADLFDLGDIEPTPTITVSASVDFASVYTGDTYTKTLNIKGENLKGDITISGLTTGELSVSTNTITKAQAEADGGFNLTLTLTPTNWELYEDEVLFDSEDAVQRKTTVEWYTTDPIVANSISDMRAKYAELSPYEAPWAIFKLTGEVTVSHKYFDGEKTFLYIYDSEGGITIDDKSGKLTTTYVAGDKIKNLIGGIEDSFGTLYFNPELDFGTPVSQGNAVNPVTATLAELQATPAKYEARLVKVENVSFFNRTAENGGLFAEGTNNQIRQAGTDARMRVFKGVNYIGNTIPANANITGISTAGNGMIIAPRAAADIVELIPEITVTGSAIFGSVYSGKTYTKTINVKGKYLKGDITIGGLTTGEVTVPVQTITKAQAEAESGFDLVLTLNPVDPDNFMEQISFDSQDAVQKKVTSGWSTTLVKNAASISDLRSQYTDDGETFRITGEVVISYIFIDGSNRTIFIQDENSAITVNDNLGKLSDIYKVGDKLKNITGIQKKSFGTSSFESMPDEGELVSENNVVTPTVVTLENLKAAPVNYEARLIKVEKVSFYNRANENEGKFSDIITEQANKNKIRQNGTEIDLWVRKGVDFVGNVIPAIADVTGISTSGSGTLIAPRAATDIVESVVTVTLTGSAIFGEVYTGETYTKTINVKGENLVSDIVVSGMTTGELSASTMTITKAQAEAAGGFDIVLTLAPADVEEYMDQVLFDSEGAAQKKITAFWEPKELIIASSISDLREKYAAYPTEEEAKSVTFKLTGEVIISYVYAEGSKKSLYTFDDEAGITVYDAFGDLTTTYTAGDAIKDMRGTIEKNSSGTLSFIPKTDFGTPVSQGNVITPITVTLAELQANAGSYEARLVKAETVSFPDKAEENDGIFTYGTSNKISQSDNEAKIFVFKGADFIGTVIPPFANITGIATAGDGTAIAPRSAADIVEVPGVGIGTSNTGKVQIWSENSNILISAENLLEIEIYNLAGTILFRKVAEMGINTISVPQGIYFVKAITDGKPVIEKVLVK